MSMPIDASTHHQTSARIGSGPIRVCLLLDSYVQPAWVAAMVHEVARLAFIEIALVVLNDRVDAAVARPKGRIARIRHLVSNRQHGLFAVYSALDRRRYRPDPDPFVPTDLSQLLRDVPVVRVQPRQTKYCDFIAEADVAIIESFHLDVALRLGFRILKGAVLESAKHGVWSYHHGDSYLYRGGPPGVWEVLEGQSYTGAILQKLTDRLDDGVVLDRRFGRTDPFSITMNTARLYWQSVPMIRRALCRLHDTGSAASSSCAEARFIPYARRLYTMPKNREMVGPLLRSFGKLVRNRFWDAICFNQWIIAYRLATNPENQVAPVQSYYNFVSIVPPVDRFYADPFPVLHDGRYYLFIEEYPYATKRGHISVMELQSDRTWSAPKPALIRPYHLSYPHIFRWGTDYFMIPETSGNLSIELYRCEEFPSRWVLDTVLFEGLGAVDATVVEHDGLWWMFVNMPQATRSEWDEELHLFWAPNPRGPWLAHRANPIKTDVRGSRPAGRVFNFNGDLYRPAQDCAVRYGHAIVFHRIEVLDKNEYRETAVSRIDPLWRSDLIATHTINSAPGMTVLDGQIRRAKRHSR